MSNPFEYADSITYSKKYMMDTEEGVKNFSAFMVRRHLSYFPDTILHASLMDMNRHLPNKAQYDYLFHSISKKKRFAKWHKAPSSEDLELVQKIYGLSRKKALVTIGFMTDEQLDELKASQFEGGKTPK